MIERDSDGIPFEDRSRPWRVVIANNSSEVQGYINNNRDHEEDRNAIFNIVHVGDMNSIVNLSIEIE